MGRTTLLRVIKRMIYVREIWEDVPDEDKMWWSSPYEDSSREDVLEMLEVYAEYLDGGDGDLVAIAASLYLSGLDRFDDSSSAFLSDPNGFIDAIEEMRDPALIREEGEMLTLGATLNAPAEYAEVLGRPLSAGDVELDLDADDVPLALRLRVEAEHSRVFVAIRFEGWGEPVTVEAPPADEVESEEYWLEDSEDGEQLWDDLREMESSEVTVPVAESITPIRVGESAGSWRITNALEIPMDDETDCEQAVLVWWQLDDADPERETWPLVTMMLTSRACIAEFDPDVNDLLPPDGTAGINAIRREDSLWYVGANDSIIEVRFDGGDESQMDLIIDSLEISDWSTLQSLASAPS